MTFGTNDEANSEAIKLAVSNKFEVVNVCGSERRVGVARKLSHSPAHPLRAPVTLLPSPPACQTTTPTESGGFVLPQAPN